MKAPIYLLAIALLTSCGGWQRVGSMTMLSTRNVDTSKPYVLLLRGVEGEAKMKHDDAMQLAVDRAVAAHPGGEYLMNVSVWVKENGKAVKVNGDVWGVAHDAGTAPAAATGTVAMQVGDRVAFKLQGRYTEGTIVGMRTTTAMVEVAMPSGKAQLREVELTKLTKLQ